MEREAADERAALYRKLQDVGMGGLTRDERERLERDRAKRFVWQEGDIVLVPHDASKPNE